MDWKSRGYYGVLGLIAIALVFAVGAVPLEVLADALPTIAETGSEEIPDPETIEAFGQIVIQIIIGIVALWKILTGKSIKK